MDIKATVKRAFGEETGYTIVGGVLGALGVLLISNVLQDQPNLLYPNGGTTDNDVNDATGGEQ